MDKINIAFYSDTYLPAMDGVVSSMLNFKRELEKRGHGVYIFASGDEHSKKEYSSRTVFISRGITFRPYPQYRIALFPYRAATQLRKMNIDIVHAQTPFSMGIAGMMISKLDKYPLVGSFHTMINNKALIQSYYPKNRMLKEFTSRYLWGYTKFFYKRCDATIVPTGAVEKVLGRGGVKNIHVVPNSVDIKRFNQKISGHLIRERLGIREGQKMVLYVGRTSREKRVEILLKAAKVITRMRSDVKFVIVGTGPALEHYKGMSARLGLGNHVKFFGFAQQELLPKIYASCDIFCIPSTFETQGIVALEAMASGKPVVGADYMALKELIKNGKNGEKFKSGDYRSCANKIERVLNNAAAYRQGAVETAKSFAVERATDRLLDVYRLLLDKKNN
ncbi:MAG: glycosyltransferase [Candidatus Micrarchaeota archaeon]|nr:glycosyltransferase [Candidatus Micrarchaeota archaeon]MDE1848319.1 glycosyltransferase [Candidatus Micrarchaeota archaeon]MDE1864545.1 glycosyltransferase [Candidatus Micrarchaeota archaeon]